MSNRQQCPLCGAFLPIPRRREAHDLECGRCHVVYEVPAEQPTAQGMQAPGGGTSPTTRTQREA